MRTPLAALLTIACLIGTHLTAGAETRFYPAAQYQWERRLGFYLDFEGSELADLPVILGVADGENWRFDRYAPGFVTGRDYHIRAIIRQDGSELLLDGERVGGSPGGWQPATGALTLNSTPAWASDMGDWLPAVRSIAITVERDGQEADRQEFAFEFSEAVTPLRFFERSPPTTGNLVLRPTDTVTIDVTMRFESADVSEWAPLIDAYGQCIYADWPGKVRSDDDLRADIAIEAAELAKMPPSTDFDRYGGYLRGGWTAEATGFFRVEERDGYWWFISPEGNPCFFTGVTGVAAQKWPASPTSEREYLFEWLPPKEGAWAGCWGKDYWGQTDGTEYVCFYSSNMIRKYGPDDWVDEAAARAARRLKAWGFTGAGKWGGAPGMATVPVLNRWGVPWLVRHPDMFDPEVRAQFRTVLEKQLVPRRDDPLVLGWTLGNEYDELVTTEEIDQVLAMADDTPVRRALLDYAVDEIYDGSVEELAVAWRMEAADREELHAADVTPPAADVEKLRLRYSQEYFGFIYETVKEIDPNHLYMGFSIVPGWWVNADDWRVTAPHCDVICYDRYNYAYEYEELRQLKEESGKPVFLGEFSFPQFHDGERGFGRYGAISVKDPEEAGGHYERWVREAAVDPLCIGMTWFTYRDQSLTGRGPGRGEMPVIGEHYAFGLITETDRPKWPLVKKMREVNMQAAQWRLDASRAP